MSNELLERIADALEELAGNGDSRGIASEISMLGDVGSQLNLIKGELYEIAGNTKSIANSQRALVSLLEDMSFSCQNKHHPTARYLRVFSDSE